MQKSKRMLERMRELCAELGPNDGHAPRERLKRQHGKTTKEDNRKVRQLCGQVARAVSLSLGTTGDVFLSQLMVDRVEPLKGATHLRVVVTCLPEAKLRPMEALRRLEGAKAWLRTEVAGAIHRKRTPQITFGWRAP